MTQDYHEQRSTFVQFLRQGLHDQVMPGGFTYDQIVQKFNLPSNLDRPARGVTCAWFQDLYFWFGDDNLLASIGIRLKPTTEAAKSLPKALNLQWANFARQLTPETFEALVIAEQIPCLKATKILDEEIYPPIYCLDHLGLMPRFEDEGEHHLYGIDVGLLRDFPRLCYEMVWPKYDPGYVREWPLMSNP
jgi:hypothetical protein